MLRDFMAGQPAPDSKGAVSTPCPSGRCKTMANADGNTSLHWALAAANCPGLIVIRSPLLVSLVAMT